jgi:uncharacterized membrane-anchored protein YhcB (DUF1043 family)|tara:strand:+ start:540 stop:1151 length:612 start_codon:yes stop_codon:yes gene_type:complete
VNLLCHQNKIKTMAEFGMLDGLMIAGPVVGGLITMNEANKAAREAEQREQALQEQLTNLEENRQSITNPFANLAVATQAAEFQAEQADISLANTLDTLAATGAGAGGATALAQAALQSKKQVSASLEKQEVANEKLRAEGEAKAFAIRETREKQKLDRTSDLLDRETMQKYQYESDAMAALTGGISGMTQGLMNYNEFGSLKK